MAEEIINLDKSTGPQEQPASRVTLESCVPMKTRNGSTSACSNKLCQMCQQSRGKPFRFLTCETTAACSRLKWIEGASNGTRKMTIGLEPTAPPAKTATFCQYAVIWVPDCFSCG